MLRAAMMGLGLAACSDRASSKPEGPSDASGFVGDWSCSLTFDAGTDSRTGAQTITITAVAGEISENFNSSADGRGCEIFTATVSGVTATLDTVKCDGATISNGTETLSGDTFTFRAGYLAPPNEAAIALTGICTKV
jgi:hypothetical protein